MMIPEMKRVKQIHFVGICVAGMGGICEILSNEVYTISGSDINRNAVTDYLSSLGIHIVYEHQPENIELASVVVASSAIAEDNPEVVAARERRIPVIQRAQMLAELMRYRY